jgi:GT2 family glycosyltransferase
MEHQLAQLALDPDIRAIEIIYVLDSPELAHELRTVARELHELFHISFQVMFLTRHLGFAGANNAAVAAAKGRLLLLLNSDVFPIEPGWISRMGAFYDRTPNMGALGVKLLYEDDTLQHAGLYFRREDSSGIWQNQHRFKGFDRNFGPANETRLVQGVTGACLMIARDRYNEVGGLSGKYLQGDYEDSDLCLRLLTAGYANWYLPDVELYHLEGQSYEWTGRSRISRYNAWTHARLWNDTITRMSELH